MDPLILEIIDLENEQRHKDAHSKIKQNNDATYAILGYFVTISTEKINSAFFGNTNEQLLT